MALVLKSRVKKVARAARDAAWMIRARKHLPRLAEVSRLEHASKMADAVEVARGIPERLLARRHPRTFAYLLLADGRHTELMALVDAVDPDTKLAIAGYALGAGKHDFAQQWYDEVSATGAAPERTAWLAKWLGAAPPREAVSAPRIAVFDYRHGDRNLASINLGDWVQTIAMLGNLARHTRVRAHGEPGFVEFFTDLQGGVAVDDAVSTTGDVELLSVERDFTSEERLDEPAWLLAYGWFMWPRFGQRFDFPFHDRLRPIFVSFHCNNPDMLTPEAVEYLTKHGPVGCRDWSTVRLLASHSVPAFFSGCVTTTLGNVVRRDATDGSDGLPEAWVEVDPPTGAGDIVTMSQVDSDVLLRSFPENLRASRAMLETYRAEVSRVVTSRLHCYLPARAMGTPVEFRPLDPGDIRFDGLSGLSDEDFDRMRASLVEKLEAVTSWILAGDSEQVVYGKWRELVAADVDYAASRIADAA